MNDVAPKAAAPEVAPLPPAFVYRWMAGLFLDAPGAEALASYQTDEGRALLDRLEAEPTLAAPVAALRALTGPGRDPGEAARQLAADHASAFLTGGRRSAPPYASVWLSPRGLLYQEPARAMNRLLAAAGLTLPDGMTEPPDHLSFQLNLLAELTEWDRTEEPLPLAPAAFLRDHMAPWLPRFADACENLPRAFFYADLGPAVSGYVLEKYMEMEAT